MSVARLYVANRRAKPKPAKAREFPVALLILLAFALGAGTTWLIMRQSADAPPTQAIESFGLPATGATTANASVSPVAPPEPPDVSQLSPAQAARTLGNWNYDRQSWSHAIDHYQQAIALGADNPDVRTDLGNCYRFLGQPQKALEQYQIAQKQNPMHENSLFNQISLYNRILHDSEKAKALAKDFLARFPQSPNADGVRQEVATNNAQPLHQ